MVLVPGHSLTLHKETCNTGLITSEPMSSLCLGSKVASLLADRKTALRQLRRVLMLPAMRQMEL